MTLTVRRAETKDIGELGKLGAMLMRTHYAFDPQRFLPPGDSPEAGYGSYLGGLLEGEENCILVAEHEGEIAGYVWAALEPLSWKELRGPAGFIHDIAVREESRRSGVAEQLLKAAVEWLREQGSPRVILWTAAQNAIAQSLFNRLGFRETMREMTLELGGS